jgi:hypothetical protein
MAAHRPHRYHALEPRCGPARTAHPRDAGPVRSGRPMRWLDVLASGLLSTCQDSGRPGWAHLGVPRSGALDGPAYELANRLVGNPASAAVLESTLGGLAVRSSTPMVVALTGAMADLVVGGRVCAWGEPVPVAAGETVEISAPRWGVRSYLAVAGGIAVEPVLGSRSTDLLSGTGPAPLRAADRLPLGDPGSAPRPVDVALFLAPARPRLAAAVVGAAARMVRPRGPREVRGHHIRRDPAVQPGGRWAHRVRRRAPPRRRAAQRGARAGCRPDPTGRAAGDLPRRPPDDRRLPGDRRRRDRDLATCAQLAPGARVRFRAPAQ